MRITLALLLSLASFAASATSSVATGDQAGKVTASLDFRIVIPETVHFDSQVQRHQRSRSFVSRTTQQHDGRTLVTVARP